MAVGSEELTVQGEAVSTQPLADVGAPAASRRQGRMSARVSGRSSVRRASLQVHAKKGDWLWAGFLVSTSLMMIMPVLLIITVSIHGFVAGNETFVQGDMKHEGKVPEFGSLFVHKFFKGFCEYTLGTPPTEPWAWWGFPSHPKQLPIDAEEVEDKPAEGGGGDGAEPAEDGGEKTDEAAEG
jgi:hypothetical protein